nr:unnamed protein product [Digitaria exilis]
MAVQAHHHLLSHAAAFLPHHDLAHAFRALDGAAVGGGGSAFLGELGIAGCAAGIGDAAFGSATRSELTCNGGEYDGLQPRKRARGAQGLMECGGQQGGLVLPLAAPHGQVFAGDVQSRAVGCGAASTSGRAVAANGVLSQLYHQGVEIDALVCLEVLTPDQSLKSSS